MRGPSGRIPVAIDARNDGRHTVMFTPREEGNNKDEMFIEREPLHVKIELCALCGVQI